MSKSNIYKYHMI